MAKCLSGRVIAIRITPRRLDIISYLIHFTLQEYLGPHPELFGRADSTMAETYLSYMDYSQVKAISASPSHDL